MTYNPTNINVGSAPNDNTGDPARTAFTTVNTNFTNAATAINNVINVSTLTDVGNYGTTTDRNLDWLVVARNLTSTYRINVQELTQAYVSVFATAGTYTWTVPTNATSVRMYCLGSGGGGGGGASGTAGASLTAGGGAGGGGGSYAEAAFFIQNSSGLVGMNGTYSVVVGAGGTAGAGKASGSTGAGGAGGNGAASYVYDSLGSAPYAYFCYANGGGAGGGGVSGATASTGGSGGSWLATLGGAVVAGTFAAGNTDTITTNIVHEWCGGPGFGASGNSGSPTAGAITLRGGAGGAGGGSILNNVVKAPGNPGWRALNSLQAGLYTGVTPQGGGAASTSGTGAPGQFLNTLYWGWGGSGGGACSSGFKAGDGAVGAPGLVIIIATV